MSVSEAFVVDGEASESEEESTEEIMSPNKKLVNIEPNILLDHSMLGQT